MNEKDPRNPSRPQGEEHAPHASRTMGPPPSFETRPADASQGEGGRKQQFRREKRDVHGWVVLDKPIGMTSTHAVAVVKRLFSARRAGHAGTLDPLASGCLPVALGEATKTVPFIMDSRKTYRFTVRWGEERDTDDAEGRVTETSAERPSREAILAVCPRFTGRIEQTPPRFSAIKIEGERAYDLARDGQEVTLQSRPVDIERLTLVDIPDPGHAVFEAACGKGTYVRALARDMGRELGCLGHVSALRRTSVGPFGPVEMISLEQLTALCDRAAAGEARLADALLPVETALDDIPALAVSRADAARLQRGQAVLLRGRDAPILHGTVYVTAAGELVALADADRGEIVPKRVFNLAGLHGSAVRRKVIDDVDYGQPQG
ncbi:MAG: tRNA pseudouridine synthase B [Alphaproteobacteria bacterium]|nr:MAG: tRNA pseudouridine synthase B [Alphaproteobacteria bacterium]